MKWIESFIHMTVLLWLIMYFQYVHRYMNQQNMVFLFKVSKEYFSEHQSINGNTALYIKVLMVHFSLHQSFNGNTSVYIKIWMATLLFTLKF